MIPVLKLRKNKAQSMLFPVLPHACSKHAHTHTSSLLWPVVYVRQNMLKVNSRNVIL